MSISLKSTKQAINKQWQDMVNSCRIPVMECRMSNGEYLECWIRYCEGNNYISFSFDADGKETWFSGNIKKVNNEYRIPLDMYFDSLDHYLQEIWQEVVEGYLMPNDLWAIDDE